ncbi:MAG: caspase family protein [Gemmataceae bacterium]
MPSPSRRIRQGTLGLVLVLAIGGVASGGRQLPPALPPDVPPASPPNEKSDGRPQRTDADNLTATPDPRPATLADRLHNPAKGKGLIRDTPTDAEALSAAPPPVTETKRPARMTFATLDEKRRTNLAWSMKVSPSAFSERNPVVRNYFLGLTNEQGRDLEVKLGMLPGTVRDLAALCARQQELVDRETKIAAEKTEVRPSPSVADLLNTPPDNPKPRPAATGRSHALLVGVREYEHDTLDELQYTENDVEKLAELLDRPGSPFAGNVRVLTTSRGQRNPADRPTAANIRRELDRLTADRTRTETVLLALAGHGVQLLVADPAGTEADRSHSFFCPADAQLTGVNYATGRHPRLINLRDALTQLGDCGAGARLVLVDACRNELKVRSRALQVKKEMVPEGVAALFSCRSGEFAHESERLKHGLFFHFVLQGLRGGAKNGRGEVTWSGLAEYVTEKVAEDAEEVLGTKVKQTPHEIKNISGRSPLLLTIGRPPAEEVAPPRGRMSDAPSMLGD